MKKKGFTLIELLVVIAIIGLLSSVILVSLSGARGKARDSKRTSDIRQVVSAQQMYYGDNENYLTAATASSTPAIGTYLPSANDPQAPSKYYGWLANNNCTPAGQFFCAYATLENKGSCSTAQYFVGSEKGSKVICNTPPTNGCACY